MPKGILQELLKLLHLHGGLRHKRRRLSDVPVTTPLRQYLRGIHKKLSYTPTHPRAARRQTLTSVVVSREVCRHEAHSVDHVPAVLAQESIIQGLPISRLRLILE
jgi:hypothetical protein